MEDQKHIHVEQEESVDFRELIEKYLYHWRWFVLGIGICLGVAAVYLRYSLPVYESKSSILIKEDEKSGGLAGLSVIKDLGLMGGTGNLENEIEVFKSRTLLEAVARKLKLNYKLQLIGNKTGFVRAEIYENAPVEIIPVKQDSLYYKKEAAFEITILDEKEYRIDGEKDAYSGKFNYGAIIRTKAGAFIINRTNEFSTKWFDKTILLSILPMNDVVSELQNEIVVEAVNKEAMVLSISLKGPQIQKNNDIINELIYQHELDGITDKNKVATNTSKFIEERMKFIAAELSEVESEGQQYKTKNNLVDVKSDAEMYLTKESETEKAITEATIQLNLADFMNEYILNDQGYDELLPSNLGFKDQAIVLMTTKYNEQVLERNKLLQNSGEKNPNVRKIEGQLSGMKQSLVQSLKNLKISLQIELRKLKSQEEIYQSKISSIPQFEKEYRDILRQQQIKETLYLYLLQKREENEMTLAASVANTKVVDYAYCNGKPVSPKKKIILLMSVLLGILVPAGIIYLRDLFDRKVHGRKDIDEQYPFIGEIPVNTTSNHIVVKHGERTPIAEAFRIVRSNMHFMFDTDSLGGKIVYVSSTKEAEGKSFVSLNLAHTIALTGKKTVVVGLDLRLPKLQDYEGAKSEVGVSNYLIESDVKIQDILQPSESAENLWVITAGIVPPNPAELLLRPKLAEMFTHLRTQFDYIIVDTAPLGLVADTKLIKDYADLTLYVVRANETDKQFLNLSLNNLRQLNYGKIGIVLNGVDFRGKGYGYGYGNSIGYGYGEVDKKRNFFRIKKR
jgi:capsular exopolysaccharide synthesis family protein